MTVTYEQLVPDVALDVIGAAEPLMVDALRKSAIQFCRQSRGWRETLAPVDLTANTPQVVLVPPAKSYVLDVIRARHIPTDSKVFPRTREQLDASRSGWEVEVADRPIFFFLPKLNTVRLVPMASATTAGALEFDVALVPTHDSDGIADELDLEYRAAIVAGAKAVLQAMPQKEWTDAASANMNASIFAEGVREARRRAYRSRTRGPLSARPVEFGG